MCCVFFCNFLALILCHCRSVQDKYSKLSAKKLYIQCQLKWQNDVQKWSYALFPQASPLEGNSVCLRRPLLNKARNTVQWILIGITFYTEERAKNSKSN